MRHYYVSDAAGLCVGRCMGWHDGAVGRHAYVSGQCSRSLAECEGTSETEILALLRQAHGLPPDTPIVSSWRDEDDNEPPPYIAAPERVGHHDHV